jgi:hypothetical protein
MLIKFAVSLTYARVGSSVDLTSALVIVQAVSREAAIEAARQDTDEGGRLTKAGYNLEATVSLKLP